MRECFVLLPSASFLHKLLHILDIFVDIFGHLGEIRIQQSFDASPDIHHIFRRASGRIRSLSHLGPGQVVLRWTHPESYNIPVVHYKAALPEGDEPLGISDRQEWLIMEWRCLIMESMG